MSLMQSSPGCCRPCRIGVSVVKKKGVLACGLHVWLVAFGRCLARRRCLVHAALCLGVAPHVVWRRVVRVSLRLRRVLLDA